MPCPPIPEASYLLKRFIDDLLERKGLQVNEAAARINEPSDRLYKWRNLGIPNPIPAYILPIWTRMIGPELLQKLAHDAQHAVAPLPAEPFDWKDGLSLGLSASRDWASLFDLFIKAIQDDGVTTRQLKEIRRTGQQAISAILAVMLAAEEMGGGVPRPRGDDD